MTLLMMINIITWNIKGLGREEKRLCEGLSISAEGRHFCFAGD